MTLFQRLREREQEHTVTVTKTCVHCENSFCESKYAYHEKVCSKKFPQRKKFNMSKHYTKGTPTEHLFQGEKLITTYNINKAGSKKRSFSLENCGIAEEDQGHLSRSKVADGESERISCVSSEKEKEVDGKLNRRTATSILQRDLNFSQTSTIHSLGGDCDVPLLEDIEENDNQPGDLKEKKKEEIENSNRSNLSVENAKALEDEMRGLRQWEKMKTRVAKQNQMYAADYIAKLQRLQVSPRTDMTSAPSSSRLLPLPKEDSQKSRNPSHIGALPSARVGQEAGMRKVDAGDATDRPLEREMPREKKDGKGERASDTATEPKEKKESNWGDVQVRKERRDVQKDEKNCEYYIDQSYFDLPSEVSICIMSKPSTTPQTIPTVETSVNPAVKKFQVDKSLLAPKRNTRSTSVSRRPVASAPLSRRGFN